VLRVPHRFVPSCKTRRTARLAPSGPGGLREGRIVHFSAGAATSRSKQTAVSQQILHLADLQGPHTPAAQVASQPDEAFAVPLLCSKRRLAGPPSGRLQSPTAACVPCADSHPAASATMHRRQKKLKTAQATATLQVTEPGRQPSVRHTHRSHSKRNVITLQNLSLQPERRSTRQRFCPRVFDPSDCTAIAGYVQQRGVSPDMQSSLPFDTG